MTLHFMGRQPEARIILPLSFSLLPLGLLVYEHLKGYAILSPAILDKGAFLELWDLGKLPRIPIAGPLSLSMYL